jgi:hypothetical protein
MHGEPVNEAQGASAGRRDHTQLGECVVGVMLVTGRSFWELGHGDWGRQGPLLLTAPAHGAGWPGMKWGSG